MYLKQVFLQNFRNYPKATFTFHPRLTVIVGPNASGKTNLVEAISLLSMGRSFRTGKEKQMIAFGEQIARVTGEVSEVSNISRVSEETKLEIVLTEMPDKMFLKKFLINDVSKRRSALSGLLPTVLFTPLDLSIISGQPGDKRRFLDEILEQTDQEYASALTVYTKALRQRNALLELVQKTGRRDEERFAYWDNLLIANGSIVTRKREDLVTFVKRQKKNLFDFTLTYDRSLISQERLLQYKDAEVGAGITLVGPQRDDIIIKSRHPISKEQEDVKYFCSRGQQRLVALELKNAQISYLQEQLEVEPLLILDDIFSELDSEHIRHVLRLSRDFQTIITTTHVEFVSADIRKDKAVIELR
jgi:DNA replication and repair protein RecF